MTQVDLQLTDTTPDGLLSVVIPNYNYDRYVSEAIASIAAQTYAPIELIVVDDASTDNSVEVIRAALDVHEGRFVSARLIAMEENVGKLGALNRALPHVRGKYFVIHDSDDLLTPGSAKSTIAEIGRAACRESGGQDG